MKRFLSERFFDKNDKKRNDALKAEKDLLILSGIEEIYVNQEDMKLDNDQIIHYTVFSKVGIKVTEKSSNVLLMLHGLGGWGNYFFRLINLLIEEYFIIVLDIPGFAFSSRKCDEVPKSLDEWLHFFNDGILAFIENLKLEKFSIAGHSFGGYLAIHLYNMISSKVDRIFLFSPAGVNFPAEDQEKLFKDKHRSKSRIFNFMMDRYLNNVFVNKKSPFYIMIKPLIPFAIRNYLKKKNLGLSEDEKNLFSKIQQYFLSLPQCGELSMGHIFYFGPQSKKPLIEIFENNNELREKVLILYGENDQIDHSDFIKNLKEKSIELNIQYIPNTDHQLIFQNPEEIYRRMKIFELETL